MEFRHFVTKCTLIWSSVWGFLFVCFLFLTLLRNVRFAFARLDIHFPNYAAVLKKKKKEKRKDTQSKMYLDLLFFMQTWICVDVLQIQSYPDKKNNRKVIQLRYFLCCCFYYFYLFLTSLSFCCHLVMKHSMALQINTNSRGQSYQVFKWPYITNCNIIHHTHISNILLPL